MCVCLRVHRLKILYLSNGYLFISVPRPIRLSGTLFSAKPSQGRSKLFTAFLFHFRCVFLLYTFYFFWGGGALEGERLSRSSSCKTFLFVFVFALSTTCSSLPSPLLNRGG